MPGVVFVNPASGSELSADDLAERFPGHRVVDCPGEDIARQVADAAREQPDFVAVAGGDGTIRGAAQELLGTGVPLLPIPGGTRNHFALAVGVSAAKTAANGVVRHFDVGDVNGHCFLRRRRRLREDLPAHLLDEIGHFFDVYKALEPQKQTTTLGWHSAAIAEAVVAEAQVRAQRAAGGH